jgi:hypothetical protein
MADGGEVKNSIDILYNIVKKKDDGFILFKKEATPIILSTCYQYPDTELTPREMKTDQFINSSFISTEGEIKITFNAKIGTLKDDKKLLRDVSNVGHWGNGDYQIKLENEAHFKDVLKLIKQIY